MCICYPYSTTVNIKEEELNKTLEELNITRAKFIASIYTSDQKMELLQQHYEEEIVDHSLKLRKVKVEKEKKKKTQQEKIEEKKRILTAFHEDRNDKKPIS